ncbi:MAG: hypothetical protein JWM53_3373 [bacterium]|nr:hypothetical protein [bacterium]
MAAGDDRSSESGPTDSDDGVSADGEEESVLIGSAPALPARPPAGAALAVRVSSPPFDDRQASLFRPPRPFEA